MLKRFYKSLGFKSIVLLGLIIAFLTALTTAVQLHYQKKDILNKEIQKAQGLGESILTGIRYPMLTGEQEIIQKEFEYYNEIKSVKGIHLLDYDGIIRRSTDLDKIGTPDSSDIVDRLLIKSLEKQKVSSNINRMHEIQKADDSGSIFVNVIPVLNEQSCYACHGDKHDVLGILKVSLDWDRSISTVKENLTRSLLLAVISMFLIALSVGLFVWKIIIAPVKKLEKAMRRISAGDMSVRLSPKTEDEIGFLMSMFNEMVEKTDELIKKEEALIQAEKSRAQELDKINRALEDEIIERKEMQQNLDEVNRELEDEIGERKLIAENLLESEGKIRALMDSIPHAIFGIEKSKVVFANNGVEKVFGWEQKDVLGKSINKLFGSDEESVACMGKIDEQLKRDGHCELEVKCVKKNKKEILCMLFAAFIEDSSFTERKVIVLEDITIMKEAENTLKESTKKIRQMYEIKSEFTSMVSHELRTPLTAIKEGIAIVLEGATGEINEDQREFLDMAKRNVDRLKRLIDDVLDFAKLESKKLEFRMRLGNINDAVVEVVQVHSPVAKEKGLYLKDEQAKDLPLIEFDLDRMLQVMNNLISNAIKFTDSGGITVSTSHDCDNNSVIISVKDTGMGIKEEDLPKLFQKFQQLGGLNQRKTGGTGLGLAISKQIIEQHKGLVEIESEYGKGTLFKVILPVAPKQTILVIDDEEDLLDLCRINLREAGYNVFTSTTGQQGFLVAAEKKPDLVISDIRLKDMNGLEMVGWLKSDKAAQNIPVLLMSGFGDEISRMEKLPKDLAMPWIAKPFTTEQLIVQIKKILG